MNYEPHYYIWDSINVSKQNGETRNDTIFHRVGSLKLTNQLGNLVDVDLSLNGKIIVFDFFFVNCPYICPKLTANMVRLQKAISNANINENDVHFISITVNPSADSFKRLNEYARRFNVLPDHWWFLTGEKRKIYNFARNDLFVNVQPGDGGPEDFIHTEKMILVDKSRYIRGYYKGLDSTEVKRCVNDILVLTKPRNK